MGMRYRVECVDAQTGVTTYHLFDAPNPNAAADLGARLGYVVGSVTPDLPDPPRRRLRRPRRWPWFLFGTVVGFLLTVGVLVGTALVLSDVRGDLLNAWSAVTQRERDAWPARWPTLAFPPRSGWPRGAIPARVAVEYDKFEDSTSIKSEWEVRGEYATYGLTFSATHPGKATFPAEPPIEVSVMVFAGSDVPLMGDLVFLADGKRIEAHRSSARIAAFCERKTCLRWQMRRRLLAALRVKRCIRPPMTCKRCATSLRCSSHNATTVLRVRRVAPRGGGGRPLRPARPVRARQRGGTGNGDARGARAARAWCVYVRCW